MRAAGRVVAIGHSAVNPAALAGAVAAGARLSTHLGNGLPQVLHKLNNPLLFQLAEDRLSASFIADGIHLLPHALKIMLRAKGTERAILVTDAVAAAATAPGLYPFAGMQVEHACDGSVRLPGRPSLAGSALTLDAAVRNLIAWGLGTPEEALRMASDNPRRVMAPALAAFSARIEPGEVAWSPDWRPEEVRAGPLVRRFA
jgi:N-acetylglucosamine-6-phosphate deacetylase